MAASASCDSPATAPATIPAVGAAAQRDVDDRHEHQIDEARRRA